MRPKTHFQQPSLFFVFLCCLCFYSKDTPYLLRLYYIIFIYNKSILYKKITTLFLLFSTFFSCLQKQKRPGFLPVLFYFVHSAYTSACRPAISPSPRAKLLLNPSLQTLPVSLAIPVISHLKVIFRDQALLQVSSSRLHSCQQTFYCIPSLQQFLKMLVQKMQYSLLVL